MTILGLTWLGSSKSGTSLGFFHFGWLTEDEGTDIGIHKNKISYLSSFYRVLFCICMKSLTCFAFPQTHAQKNTK